MWFQRRSKNLSQDACSNRPHPFRALCVLVQVSILTKTKDEARHFVQSTKLHVYDVDGDKMYHYDFMAQSRFPISHCWDQEEPRLLACETRRFGVVQETPTLEDSEASSRIEVHPCS